MNTIAMNTNRRTMLSVLRVVLVAGGLATMAATQGCTEFGLTSYNQYARLYGGPVPLTLTNDSGRQACYIRISPAGTNVWGDDWLGSTEIVYPGVSRTFYLASNGTWDIRVETCNHRESPVAEVHGLQVAGAMSLSLARMGVSGMPYPFTSGGEASFAPIAPPAPVTIVPPPWQNNVSTQVVVNNPGAVSMDDVITLHDGTLLRGHVAELRPSQQVTLVLLSGETRTVAWEQLASAAGPSFLQGSFTFR